MEVVQYKCPNCGANLEFQAESQDFGCRYCSSAFTSEQIREIYPENEEHKLDVQEPERTPEEIAEAELFGQTSAAYDCPNCGAGVVTDDHTSATHCVYCLSPIILTGRLSGEYKPSRLIPFKITKQQAGQMLKEFCKARKFLPKGFTADARLEEITAIYVPYWLATCRTNGSITAACKKVRSWRSGNYRVTETKEYIAVRSADMGFNRIPHDASSRADDVLMECIEPFDYNETTDFKMSFLSGYIAEKYDVDKQSVYPKVRQRAVQSATDVMKSTITGYTSVNITNNTVDIYTNQWEHFLLPVWFLSYKHGDKIYHFAVNGQSGKFAGNLPVVWGKVALVAGGLAAAATALLGFVMFGGVL